MTSEPDAERPANVNTMWAGILADEFVRLGLQRVVIAPGSRSAPLVFQFARRPEIEDISVVDERSAGFFALGLARASDRPVALVCTSGTAAANFLPAICEAAHDDVPLLILSGDRPAEDQECGAQQVMDQHGLYGRHVRWFHQLAQPEIRADKLRYLRALACRAWAKALGPRPGPVHLDVPVRKPLEPIRSDTDDAVPDPLPESVLAARAGRPDRRPWLDIHCQTASAPETARLELGRQMSAAERPIILAGTDPVGVRYRESVRDFAVRAGVPILAEAGSELRHWSRRGDTVIASAELIAASGFYARAGLPDLIIRLGHPPLTWAMQKLVAEAGGQIQVAGSDRLADPDHVVERQIVADPAQLFSRLTDERDRSDRADWLARHRAADAAAVSALTEALAEQPAFTAPRFWHELGGMLPRPCALYYSSSMLVRHLETFMCSHTGELRTFFNRGLNGIDGVVSTACGLARGRTPGPGRMVLVIGDVALRHDAQALILAIEQQLDLTVFVIDNDGGEIFEYLPSAGFEGIHEKHFATGGGTPLASILPRTIELTEPDSWPALERAARRAFRTPGLNVVRVPTDRRADHRLRAELLETVGRSIRAAASDHTPQR
jgi:2-succinyl-5-enolpyruvyl-6-hydroxy-3-cyclohexene-1-carboxylate synthase